MRTQLRQPEPISRLRPPGDLDQHFAHASPAVRATFDRTLETVRRLGPVEVLPEKTSEANRGATGSRGGLRFRR